MLVTTCALLETTEIRGSGNITGNISTGKSSPKSSIKENPIPIEPHLETTKARGDCDGPTSSSVR